MTNRRVLTEATVVAAVLTTLSYLVGLAAGWINDLNALEAFAVATSFACTYLCVKQKRINYPIGAVSTAAYAVLFIQEGLVASALLNAYLTPALVYGWFRWRADAVTRPVGFVALRWWPAYVVATGLSYGGAVWLLDALDSRMAPIDATILVGSMLAQFLLDNKKIETWAVWALVNVAAIYTYFTAGLALAGFQYIFFLANTLYGAWSWRQAMKTQQGAPESAPEAAGTPVPTQQTLATLA